MQKKMTKMKRTKKRKEKQEGEEEREEEHKEEEEAEAEEEGNMALVICSKPVDRNLHFYFSFLWHFKSLLYYFLDS